MLRDRHEVWAARSDEDFLAAVDGQADKETFWVDFLALEPMQAVLEAMDEGGAKELRLYNYFNSMKNFCFFVKAMQGMINSMTPPFIAPDSELKLRHNVGLIPARSVRSSPYEGPGDGPDSPRAGYVRGVARGGPPAGAAHPVAVAAREPPHVARAAYAGGGAP